MRSAIQEVLNRLENAGYDAYIVGGYVRDFLLGIQTKDCDITTNATPDQVESLFERVVTVGKVHGTIGVLLEGEMIEVTTYRIDGAYDDHRHPTNVTFTASLEADLMRRDFTINAMAMNKEGIITDLVGGQVDLQAKLIRAVGDPRVRLQEDALRILRAIRFQSVLGFTIESQLYEAMKHHASLITQLSKERVLDELRKFFKGSSFKLARQTYEALALPGLPTKLIAKEQLSIIEHMAIASLMQGYDAGLWPWTKEEKVLLQKLVSLQQGVPSDVELYRMTDVESMINVGAVVYGWDAEQLTTRWQRLAIHHRKELNVNGHDIMALGYEGPNVEAIFMAIEEAVLRHQLDNKKERIIEWMKEKFDEHQ